MKKLFLFILACLTISSFGSAAYPATGNAVATQAQGPGVVKGRIVDENGDPVIGAYVHLAGQSTGTITDMDGYYTLNANEGDVLVIDYVGYSPKSVPVSAAGTLDIALEGGDNLLENAVVVGYGTQKKANLTGAVSAVSGETISRRPVANSAVLLQGVIPGLNVHMGSGAPGAETITMRVRGQGTFSSAGSEPMILINGVQGSLENIDPSTIESVSVLKDAASAAIYGARAANGVILVTTKEGAGVLGKTSISYNGNVGFHTASKMLDIITDSPEFMRLANTAWANSGAGKAYTQEMIDLYEKNRGSVEYPSFDWQRYMFVTATVQNHNLAVAGTSGDTNYNINLNFVDQPGILRGFEYKKYNATINLSSKINNFIKIGTYNSLMYGDRQQNQNGQGDTVLSTLSQAPTYMPWLPDDGSGIIRYTDKAYQHEEHNKNMAAIVGNNLVRDFKNFDINTQLWLEVQLAKGLTWFTKGAARLNSNKETKFIAGLYPIYMYHTGEQVSTLDTGSMGLWVYDQRRFYTNLYSYLKYDLNLGATQNSLMVGYNQEKEKFQQVSAYRREFPFPLGVLDAGSNANWSNGGYEENWAIQSIFARYNFNYKDRYLFEANARYDGTSRIAPKHRWGMFPSFSAGWRVTEEDFMSEAKANWLTYLKLRGSWGQLGNQNIGLYPYQAMISQYKQYPFTKTADGTIDGYTQTAYANEDIMWETTTVLDFGFDATILKGWNLSFDWYRKVTSDILRGSQVSALLGLDAPTINDGIVQNSGVELSTDYTRTVQNGFFKGLTWNLGGNIVMNKNKLIKFGAEEIDWIYRRKEGEEYEQYYMLVMEGIFADEEEIRNSPKQFNDNTLPGDIKYKDANGDGVVNYDDRVALKGAYPAFEYGLTGSATWKNFDLSFIGQGIQGKKMYTDGWGMVPFQQGSAPTKDYIAHMWTEENPKGALYPKLYWANLGGSKNNRESTYFLQDASFFRLKNLTLGYTVPRDITRKAKIENLRVYFSGDNLFTLTPFKGYDPERWGDGQLAYYPQNRVVSFGVNITF